MERQVQNQPITQMESKNSDEVKQPHPGEEGVKNDDCKCSKDCGCCDERKEKEAREFLSPPKAIAAALLFLMSSSVAFGQDQASASFWSDPFNSPMLPVYLTLAFVGLTVVLATGTLIYVLKVFKIIVRVTEQERAAKLGIPVKSRPSWWQTFWEKINALSPVEKEHDLDTGHNFDGIRELDNHLPPWWTGLFYATVIWGVIYLVVYHITDSFPLSGGEYQNELAEAERNARALQASRPAEVIDADGLEYKQDEEILERGRAVFASSMCSSCHRNDGGGNAIGPNLTDEYWIHGGSIRNIYSSINGGIIEKGMPAWGKTMSPRDVRDVAFFVMSLKGSNPPNAKAPQGELYKEEPIGAVDSTRVQAMNQ
jgi:cytochrome c oxidase cbb3-type subunit 3